MAARREHIVIWVVVRVDHFLGKAVGDDPTRMITLKEALPTPEEAQSEAARLNDLGERTSDGGRVEYFAAATRYFSDGRAVQIGY